MSWAPLLGDAAMAAVLELARDVAGERSHAADRTLFWAYLSNHVDEPFVGEALSVAVNDVMAELRVGMPLPALHGGLAGVGWSLAHVLGDDAADVLALIDRSLLAVLDAEPGPGDHDLSEGLAGLGVYFLERGSRDALVRVVEQLDRCAIRTDAGTTWITPVSRLPERERAAWGDHYDCGVAHGTPGVIAVLARVASLADPPPRARPLCEDAIRWLRAQRLSDGFPTRVHAERAEPTRRARAAWCYGDPGVAAASWAAAGRLGISDADAREWARAAARRDPETCGVTGPQLCHGTAGLAHLFNRMYQASGDPELGDAARAWFERTLAMQPFEPIPELLDGVLGIGLALLAAATTTEPQWDRMLAL